MKTIFVQRDFNKTKNDNNILGSNKATSVYIFVETKLNFSFWIATLWLWESHSKVEIYQLQYIYKGRDLNFKQVYEKSTLDYLTGKIK